MAAVKQQRGPQVVHDPQITVGDSDGRHLRVLKRTDGAFVIFDPARKPGDNAVTNDQGQVMLFRDAEGATKEAKAILAKEGG